jgi:hypothetical protein
LDSKTSSVRKKQPRIAQILRISLKRAVDRGNSP